MEKERAGKVVLSKPMIIFILIMWKILWCRCLTGAGDVYGALVISLAFKLPVTGTRVILDKGN